MPVVAFIWALIGLVLGWPYHWLSGGEEAFFVPCILLVPIATGVGAFIYAVESARRHRWTPSPAFGVYLLWILSPIFMNSLSHLLRTQGYENAARIAFEQRFLPFWLPVVIILVIALIINDLLDSHNRLAKFQERSGNDSTFVRKK